MNSTEIKEALATLLANRRMRAITEDYIGQRLSELKRFHVRVMADDAADGGDTYAVSAPTGFLGHTLESMNGIPVGGTYVVPTGVPIAAPSEHFNVWGSEILARFGMRVKFNGSIHTTVTSVNRRTSSPMSDRPSSVAPIRPSVNGSAASVGRVISWRMRNALSVIAPDVVTEDSTKTIYAFDPESVIWPALETVIRTGFSFPTADGTTRNMPFNPVAMRRAIDAAHKEGKTFYVDRLDDVISEAVERAYASLLDIASNAAPDDVVTHDGSAHAPMGHVAGYLVMRDIRCGNCSACQHNGSRYVIGNCAAPGTKEEYVDAQRVLSRALYASASASVTSERYASLSATGILPDSNVVDDVSRDCGHGAECLRDSCRGKNVLHAATVACEALGIATISGNGKASTEFLDLIALALGNAPTEAGRRLATDKLRALLDA